MTATVDPRPARPADGEAATDRPSIPHVAAFDGLRGVAVLAVLAHHDDRLLGGWLGVDLFFVLSGYLITALLLSGWRRSGRVDLRGFWARRARRLAPALLLTLLGVSAYAALVAQPTELAAIRADGLATLLEVANWHTIWTSGDYWAAGLRPSPLRHTWSLSIEEQLYVLWPLAVAAVLARRRSPRDVLVMALALAAASVAVLLALQATGASRSRLYYGTDTRAVAVMLGAAVAAGRLTLGPQRWAATRPARQALGLLAAVGLAIAWWGLDGSTSLPYRGALPLAGLAGALVVAAVADRRHPGPLGTALSMPVLGAIGRVSYGAYLYHWPLFLVLTEARLGIGGWTLTGVRVAATLGLAFASYHLVERPIRAGGWPTGRTARAALPAAIAFTVIALLATTLDAAPRPTATGGPVARSAAPDAPLVLLVGDSVSLLLGTDLATRVDDLEVSVLNRAVPGCHPLAASPIRGVEGNVRDDVTDCVTVPDHRAVIAEHQPDAVVVLFGEFPNQAAEVDGRWTMPCQRSYLEPYGARLEAMLTDLASGGAPVLLLTAPGSDLAWVVDRVEPGMAERVACSNAQLRELADRVPGVQIADLEALVCPGGPCPDRLDGIDLRPDGLHFEGDGALLVNRWLVEQVREAVG